MSAHPKPARRGPRPRTWLRRNTKPLRRSALPRRTSRVPQRSKTRLAKLIAEADRLFAELVKRPGACRNCGASRSVVPLDCAHHISRRWAGVRWNLDGASPLCRSCHRHYTARPALWIATWHHWIGDAKAERLKTLAREGVRLTAPYMECVIAGLRACK